MVAGRASGSGAEPGHLPVRDRVVLVRCRRRWLMGDFTLELPVVPFSIGLDFVPD